MNEAQETSSDDRPTLKELTESLIESYRTDARTEHIDSAYLPKRDQVIDVLSELRELVFPGFFGKRQWTSENVNIHVGQLLESVRGKLEYQIDSALRYAANVMEGEDAAKVCADQSKVMTDQFLAELPQVRRLLALDVQAAYDGDPAARHTDETIFAYPGVYAIFVHRIAHQLFEIDVPLLPRIMSEHAHTKTGIDIHPGATIGESFFIDHGTGVVIGETTLIGDRCKVYQGVTLGALSFPKDERGRVIRGVKRHPTLENEVTIYANAIILGGETVIGKGAVVGGSVFITKSVPDGHTVALKPPELRKYAGPKSSDATENVDGGEVKPYVMDFVI